MEPLAWREQQELWLEGQKQLRVPLLREQQRLR